MSTEPTLTQDEKQEIIEAIKVVSEETGTPIADLMVMNWTELEPLINRSMGANAIAAYDAAKEFLQMKSMALLTEPLPRGTTVGEALSLGLISHAEIERAMSPTDDEIAEAMRAIA